MKERELEMAVQEVQEFLSNVKEDETLQRQLQEIGDKYKGEHSNLRVIIANNILPTARKLGYMFTVDEYLNYVNQFSSKKIEVFGQLEGLKLQILFPGCLYKN